MIALRTEAEAELHAQFDARPPSAPAQAAFAQFAKAGLPTRRVEAWHYTDLRASLRHAAKPASAPDEARLAAAAQRLAALPAALGARLVLVDGRYIAGLSDSVRVSLAPSEATKGADPVEALSAAFADHTLSIEIDAPARLEIVHLDGPGAIYSSLALTLAEGVEATVFERFDGATAATQRHAAAVWTLGDHAKLAWTTLIDDEAGVHLEFPRARLGQGAALEHFGLIAGGALVRRQIDAGHDQEGANIALSGLSLIEGARHADTTLTVRHEAPHGVSREVFRYIVADEGLGVYQGKVIVAPGAQKTDGAMKSKALLLSPGARMNNKPELEIFADDVVCGHGATVGALDPEQVFYLQARGIPAREAEAMLLEAFGAEALEQVADEAVRDVLTARLQAWLRGRAS